MIEALIKELGVKLTRWREMGKIAWKNEGFRARSQNHRRTPLTANLHARNIIYTINFLRHLPKE
jgi:hypothetical protein